MLRIAIGLTALLVAAVSGFDAHLAAFAMAIGGTVLVLSGVDRTLPARTLVVRTARPEPRRSR